MSRARFRLIDPAVLVAFAVAAVVFVSSLPVAESASAQARRIPINQKRVRIEQLVRKVGEATGRTILVPDDVRGSISIVAQRAVEPEEAWQIMESSLSILGFSLLPSTVGNWRIAKIAESVGEAPFVPGAGTGSDSFVTTLVSLRHAALEDVMPVLEPLSGTRVTLVPYPRTNSLIASGSERSIARLAELAVELDRVEEQTLRMKVLRYRGVEDVEPMVEGYLDQGGRALSRVQVWSDARTNSLLVRGEDASVDRVIAFLDRLDEPVVGEGALRVLPVLHRDPAEIAEIIQQLGGSSSAAADPALAEAAGPLDGSDFTIAVDAPTRSLLVRADPRAQTAIRELVELLDERPQLIAVDVTVTEVRTPAGRATAFGFLLPFATGDEDDVLGVFQNAPDVDRVLPGATFTGRFERDTGVEITTDVDGASVVIPILQTGTVALADFEARTDVLIQPSLVVTAGDRHEIFVGDEIPIPTNEPVELAQVVPGVGAGVQALTRRTNVERTEVGTRLAIEATAGSEGEIELDLELELSSVNAIQTALVGNVSQVGPILSEKRLTVRARLDDGESAIVAGYDRQEQARGETGVPFLKDVPFFGRFFRGRSLEGDDVRLVVVARVRRISNPAELVAETIRRRLVFERNQARTSGLPSYAGPPYGVRVTTRLLEADARAIAESLDHRGHRTRVHRWKVDGVEYYDVYVTHLGSMSEAADLARVFYEEGWESDVVVFPPER